MSANPRVVTNDVTFTWDGGQVFLRHETMLDVPPGSALEAAIGTGNLGTLSSPMLQDAANGSSGAVSN